jgi:outer membrane protein OmpA-like peptidoglycan-associated protein
MLLTLLPFAAGIRMAAAATVLGSIAIIWVLAGRRSAQLCESLAFADNGSLPSAAYRQPVVLVCGGGQVGLFAANATGQSMLRVTEQGCYVSVPELQRLPHVVASLLAIRPDWSAQLSVMFVVSPAEHTDHAVLAGQIRALCHQIALVRKRAIELPLLLVSYLHASHGEQAWFSWEAGHDSPDVRHAGGCVSLKDWQWQTADESTHRQRLEMTIQLKSLIAWLNHAVTPHLAAGGGRRRLEVPVACAATSVSALPGKVENNLWQTWLREKTALLDGGQPARTGADALPFPDPLLALLPRHTGDTASRRAGVIAVWMFAMAAVVALANSAWQNTLLLRQVSDDLRRYASLDEQRPVLREEALSVLRNDAQRLDDYYRHGEPLPLGLGLYRAERLRGLLWEVIASYRPPLVDKPTRRPEPVRLDSLSLFNTGSADLKPGSTKVLINALVDIKAQAGWLIVITGHTDATGNPEQNLHLSRARAAAVRDWMQRMGDIPDSCFAVQGFAASQPVASNDTEQGRASNRRVDIRLVPEEGACVPLATAPDGKTLSHSATLNE